MNGMSRTDGRSRPPRDRHSKATYLVITVILMVVTGHGQVSANPDDKTLNKNQAFDMVGTFGADPSGDTDSTNAIAKAVASSDAQPVVFPCGVYKVSHTITVPPGGMLIGTTNYPWFYPYRKEAMPCVRITPTHHGTWDGPAAVVLGGYTHIEGIGVDAASLHTVPVFLTTHPFDELIHIWTNGGLNSVRVAYNTALLQQGTRIRSSDLTNAHGDCVYLESTADFDIIDNDINGCTGYAINDNASTAGIIANNILQDSDAGGLRIGGIASSLAVSANRFDGNKGPAIFFSEAGGSNSFSGNQFRNNGLVGGEISGAHLVWNATDHSQGCQTFTGNSYLSSKEGPQYLAIVQRGATVTCGAFFERMPVQQVSVFGPTAYSEVVSLKASPAEIVLDTGTKHGVGIERSVRLTIKDANPTSINGTYWCRPKSPRELACPSNINLRNVIAPGAYSIELSRAVLEPFWLPPPSDIPGAYDSDEAAARAGVSVGSVYFHTSGVLRKRVR